MAHDAHEPADRSNPVLWTVGLVVIIAIVGSWFAHWFDVGTAHGRGEMIELPKDTVAAPIDHAALIKDRSQAVLDNGQIIFGKICATCHGPTGQEPRPGLSPAPRNFHKDAFLNPNGGGPYGLYTVLENGFRGNMPAQPGLSAADKYAVIHYVRETFVKVDNKANYLENDLPETAKKIPKPGEGPSAGPQIPPVQRPFNPLVAKMLAGESSEVADDAAAADAWIVRAADGAPAGLELPLGRLTDHRGSGAMTSLYRASRAGDAGAIRALLARGDSSLYQPGVTVMADREVAALTQRLIDTAPGHAPAAAGAK